MWVESSIFRETNGMLFACLLVPTSEYDSEEIGGGKVEGVWCWCLHVPDPQMHDFIEEDLWRR